MPVNLHQLALLLALSVSLVVTGIVTFSSIG